MSQQAANSARTLAENEFLLSAVPSTGALLVADAVAVFRVGDRLCAIQSRCPHRGGPLDQGQLEGTILTCPWHGAQFDVCTGALLRGPAETPIETYRVRVDGTIGQIEVE